MTEVADQFTEERSGEVARIAHWIGGQRVEGTSGRNGPVYNPATGEQSGEVDFAAPEEIDAAVQAARRAFESWRTMSLSRRTELFFRIRELFHDHSEDLARLLTLEHGKVLSDAKGEVARGLEVIEFCCGISELLKGSYSEQASTGSTSTRFASRTASSPGSRRSTSPRWCPCGCGRPRSPAATPSC